MQFPIHIKLCRSRLLSVLLFLCHATAAAGVIALPWSWLMRALLLALIGASTWRTQQPSKILGLRLSARGDLDCQFASGERAAALVLPGSVVFNQLIVLRLQIGDARWADNLALLPDSISFEQFRVLRLWLRWRSNPGTKKTGISEYAGKDV